MKIARFDKGVVSSNGKLVKFEAHTIDGKIEDIEIPVKNIGDMIAFLAGLAQFAVRKKTHEQLVDDHAKGQYEGALIDPIRIGIARGRTPQEMVLAFQVGEFSLGFAVGANQLQPLLALLAQQAPKQAPTQH